MNKMTPFYRKQEVKKIKSRAVDKGEPPPGWSISQTCETYLAQNGSTAYNKWVKKCNKMTVRDRENAHLPSEPLHPYLDLATKHWKSIIVTKQNMKRAMVLLYDENPESTGGEGEESGVLVCQQVLCSFIARLPQTRN